MAADTLAFTAATPAAVVSAAKKAKTVKVVYSVSEGPDWMLAPKTLTVSADLDDRYAELTGYTDDSDVPTMLDATIAAHIEVYDDEMPGLKVTSGDYGAYITCAFRLDTSAVGYFINDAQDNGEGDYYNLDTELKNGDEIRFFFSSTPSTTTLTSSPMERTSLGCLMYLSHISDICTSPS